MTASWLKSACLASVALAWPSLAFTETCTPKTFDGAFAGEVASCQNWSDEERQTFWFLSQGSQIIPYAWFLQLEQAGSEVPFRDPANMDGFRYLPQKPTERNLDGLPVGFTKDSSNGSDEYADISDSWLGMTCAACHTGQVEYGGRKLLIDGAPTMADFEGFTRALAAALRATHDDPGKFDRFARAVLGGIGTAPDAKAALKEQLERVTEIREAWNARNHGPHPYGFARLDAIGAIFNEVGAAALAMPESARAPDAPVSYPFIWDTPQHDVVQWNGSVPNKAAGALGRNIGEVLGVFGSLSLNNSLLLPKRTGHRSSVDVRHLGQIEGLLWKLQAPQWRETPLPAIDDSGGRLAQGRALFEQHCLRCHADIRPDDPGRRIQAVLTPLGELGTDPAMAEHFAERVGNSGPAEGRFKTYVVSPDRFGSEGGGVEFLRYAVAGVIYNNLVRDPFGTLSAINAGRDFGEAVLSPAVDLPQTALAQLHFAGTPEGRPAGELVYKARPLDGIWATAPYLHNGSVRTLRQLLLPAAQRQRTFHVGSREYDPKEVGFVDAGGFLFDTSLPGNSNAGHEYGADALSRDPGALDALLEYLKTL